jgi:hypothetical protein
MEVAPRSTAAINPAEGGMPSSEVRLPLSDSARLYSASRPASDNRCTSIETLLLLTPMRLGSFDLDTRPCPARAIFMIVARTRFCTSGRTSSRVSIETLTFPMY